MMNNANDMKQPSNVTHESGPVAFAFTNGGAISGDCVPALAGAVPLKTESINVGGRNRSDLFVTSTHRTVKVGISSPLLGVSVRPYRGLSTVHTAECEPHDEYGL